MRLFIGIDLKEFSEELKNIIEEIKKAGGDVKFVEDENFHITLKFLGEVREDCVNELVNKISLCLKNVKQFKISLEGVGFFGSEHYIRVIWVGVNDGRDMLIDIMKRLNETLSYIRRDDNISPHLTLGRIRSGKNREKLLEKINELKDIKIGETIVKEIKLKQSILTRHGPIYKDISTFPLNEK